MSNQQRLAALAIARATDTGHTPLRWLWPVNNCFDTRQPVVEQHTNAVKCNYTPLPGRACKRQLRRQRALTGNARRARAN